ncbi:MAG TPA: ABC transporter ATP-binding protein [Ignavibacteriaceae bacterium]|nr:ABC transporter ATP-binding protein [Ignavibacteriaceae bacterium]
MNILELEKVVKTFGSRRVLDDLTFNISSGIIFGLIGPNGAGKSTTINCIADLLNLDSGSIKIFGRELKENEIEIKKRLGILYENTDDLFIHLKGEEHLHFVGEVYGLDKDTIQKRLDELFDYFEIEAHRQMLIEKYSKGMQKKIALASILLHNPDFIILDEPFESLDALTIIKVKRLLNQLREKGKTILVTSHILSYIEDISDEVAIINKGKIVYQSATKDIRNKIRNEITNETYQSLEEIFLDVTQQNETEEKTLSWL